jgi:UDP-N-acetylglucosamine acyltransferase
MTQGLFTVIEGGIDYGLDVEIGPLCYLKGPLALGDRVRISPHCVIGTDAEHRSGVSSGVVRIGKDTTVRELSVIQRGTGDRHTSVGARCHIADHAHIAHDCEVGDDVTISPNVSLAGHVRVHRGATLGMGSSVHQFCTIGAYSMVGMGAVVLSDVPPFALVFGNPAGAIRLNTHVFEKLGIADGDVRLDRGRVVSDHPFVQHYLERYAADAGRRYA